MTEFKKIEGVIIGKKYKPGFRFRYGVTIPCIEQEEFALCLEHDNLNIPMANSLMKLADEGKAPYCVTVGVTAGHIVMPNETERNMRMNTYDLFDRFRGWTDRRLFEELTAKLNAIKDNYSSYIEKSEDTAAASVDTQPAQNVTNVYFQGNISGANISTGDNTNQELHNTPTEKKTWMEKYGIQLLVAFIGAAATIGAVFLTWWLTKG